MLRVPPWWVVARPARRSRSVNDRVMISCAGSPAWSGRSPVAEESAAGFFERVVQPLPRRPVVRTERVVGPAGGQWGEDGVPDGLAGRGEPPVQQPGRIGQPVQGHAAVRLLQPLLRRARAVRVQVGQDPLTQQPHRARVHRAGMLQQRGLDRSCVLGAIGGRDGFDGVRDRRRMLRTDRTIGERLSGGRVNRLQGLTGQRPPSPEPLHRLRPPSRLGTGAPNLRGDQISQPAQAQSTRHVPRVQLRQHRKLPELHPAKLRLQHSKLSKQPLIRRGSQLLDHTFDSTVPANPRSIIYVQKTHTNKGQTHLDNATQRSWNFLIAAPLLCLALTPTSAAPGPSIPARPVADPAPARHAPRSATDAGRIAGSGWPR